MKFLIWFGCVLVVAVIRVAAESSGVILGAIPMMLLFGGMAWVASTLCRKYDERKSGGSQSTNNRPGPPSPPSPPGR